MKMVDHMHERTEEFSTKDIEARWIASLVRLRLVFRQSRWVATYQEFEDQYIWELP